VGATLVPDLLRDQAARSPEAPAVSVDGGGGLTFGAWEARSNRLARALGERGVAAGDRVALLFSNADALAFVTSYLAIHKAGAVAVPLGPRSPVRELAGILSHSGARALLHGSAERAAADALARERDLVLIGGERLESALVTGDESAYQVARTPGDLADILYTSGTTGTPKGVACSHAAVLFAAGKGLVPFAGGTLLHAIPLFTFGGTHAMTLLPLRAGMRQLVMPRFDARRFLELCASERVSVAYAVPSMLLIMLEEPRLREGGFDALRLLMHGTAPMPPVAVRRLADAFPEAWIVNVYGLTEGGGAACTLPPGEARRRPGSIGRPVPPSEARVVDEAGRDCAPWEQGEIWLRAAGAPARAYYRDEDASAQAWSPEGWLRTGDLGYADPEGYLFLVDRKKDLVIRGGFNVSTTEVEATLVEHPAVRATAVVGVPHAVLGEDTFAFVVPRGALDPRELEVFLRERLADYKVPRHYAVVDELPRNALDKVLKRELRERARAMLAPRNGARGSDVSERHVEAAGIRFRVREAGSGPPVVLGHSLTLDGAMWRAQLAALAERHRVIAVDLHGHGGTEWTPAAVTLERMADDLAVLLDALDVRRCLYAGLSLGGMLGMRLCLRHPGRVAALGLLSTSAEPESESVRALYDAHNEQARAAAVRGDASMRAPTAEMLMGLLFSRAWREREPAEAAGIAAALRAPPSPLGLYEVTRAVLWRESVLDALGAIAVPTLVVVSAGDRAIDPERGRAIARAVPGARLVELGEAGHVTAVERPSEVTRALTALADEALERGAWR
jgi:fatty-acyl-CoA synthase/long-chain acyl-CoA synthetase